MKRIPVPIVALAMPGSARRGRRIALALGVVAVVLGVAGAISFRHFATRAATDPGFVYRDRATLKKLLKRAHEAENSGDRGTAIATYRFIVAVGTKEDTSLQVYVQAAREGLARMERSRDP